MDSSKKIIGEVALATAKGAIGSIPIAGGFLTEYIDLAQEKIRDKRFLEWKSLVESRLIKLESTPYDLSKNEFFFSCVQIVSTSAMKSYQQEKRQLFANSLLNSIKLTDISEDKKLFFLNLLDKYTLNSISLLNYYKESHYQSDSSIRCTGMVTITTYLGTENPIEQIIKDFPIYQNEPDYLKSLSSQLINDDLIIPIDWNMPKSPEQARAKKTTKLGDEFLRFITES